MPCRILIDNSDGRIAAFEAAFTTHVAEATERSLQRLSSETFFGDFLRDSQTFSKHFDAHKFGMNLNFISLATLALLYASKIKPNQAM